MPEELKINKSTAQDNQDNLDYTVMRSPAAERFEERVNEQIGFLGNLGLNTWYAGSYLARKVRDESGPEFEKENLPTTLLKKV